MPVFYECQRCTACCRWPGIVRITEDEIARMAKFLNLSEFEFIQRYTRLAEDRRRLVLKDNDKGECVFLNGNDCVVQPVKPQQCRDFPNLWNFPGFEALCKAIPRQVADDEYRSLIEQAANRKDSDETPASSNLPPTSRPGSVPSELSAESTFKPFSNP